MSLTEGVTGDEDLRRVTVTGPSFEVGWIGKSVHPHIEKPWRAPFSGSEGRKLTLREKPLRITVETVPHTDTGRQVEYTKGYESTLVKEFGKVAP